MVHALKNLDEKKMKEAVEKIKAEHIRKTLQQKRDAVMNQAQEAETKMSYEEMMRHKERRHMEVHQQWVWEQAHLRRHDPSPELWSHDDNMAVQHKGFMICGLPRKDSKGSVDDKPKLVLDLFTLNRERTAAELLQMIRVGADQGDYYCQKAIAVLAKSKFMFPDYPFNYLKK